MNQPNGSIIKLDHGSGGKAFQNLLHSTILKAFDHPILHECNDSAVCTIENCRIAFTTDSYIVDPLFFPGGCIGDLAINGTVNDLSMSGAIPLYLSVGLVIEEGFDIQLLNTILRTMNKASSYADVHVVTGDTKVMPKGALDQLIINTSGIGLVQKNLSISCGNAQPGDKIILSGTIAEHGIAVLMKREQFQIDTNIQSDTAPLNHMVHHLIQEGCIIHSLRDPTRGGLAACLNEIAIASGYGIDIWEHAIPVHPDVQSICDLFGYDPLYIANEGKLIACIPPQDADKALSIIQKEPFGKNAAIIGEIIETNNNMVLMTTAIGGKRIVDMPVGEQLPRIC